MSTYPHLRNAPIVEALIDIKVNPSPNVEISKIREFGHLVKEDYPEERIQRELKISFSLGQARETSQADIPYGHRYESSDSKQVVQARVDGFTFSILKKYTTWEDLRGEARRLWQLYLQITRPALIKRVAVRFINYMELAIPLEEYLTAPPIIPTKIPNDIKGFLTRTVIYDKLLNAFAIITQILKNIEENGTAPIILDIDVYRSETIDVEGGDAWDIIESFHELKNRIFFGSITNKTLGIYK